MKKSALILLAIILCLSLCLTGCNMGDNPTKSTEPSGSTTPAPQPERLDKTAAIEAFNSFDITKVMDNTGLSKDDVTKLMNEIKVGMDLSINTADANMTASVAVKDGYAYYNVGMGENSRDFWIYFGNGSPAVFKKNDGVWEVVGQNEPVVPMSSVSEQSQIDAAYEQAEAILKLIKKPELKEAHLVEKNGMLYINNDFILDALKANAALLLGYDPEEAVPAEELNEFMEEAKESLKASGLEIAFAANSKAVTKLHIAMKVDETSELGKEFLDDSHTVAASIDMDITDDGTMIKNLTFKATQSFEEIEKGLKPETLITLNTVFNDKNEAVGFKLDVSTYAVAQNWAEDENTIISETDIYEIVMYKATAKGFVDSSKFTSAGEECASLTFKLEPTKAFKRTVVYDVSDTSVAMSLSDADCYNVSANLKITCESANKLVATGSLDMTYGGETMTYTASGNLYMNNVLNFPISIPAEITAYVNAQ